MGCLVTWGDFQFFEYYRGAEMSSNTLMSGLALFGLALLRFGVPLLGIWLLGVVLKHALGTHREGKLSR